MCDFCSIANQANNKEVLGFDRFLLEINYGAKSYTLMADYSPIYPGHYLLVSKECKPGMLEDSKLALEDYYLVIGDVLEKIESNGEFIIYEHGGSKCKTNGCQEHAHTHFVQIKQGYIREAIAKELEEFGFNSYKLRKNRIPKGEYLHFLTDSQIRNKDLGTVYQDDHKIPSALVRFMINYLDTDSGSTIVKRGLKEEEYFKLAETRLRGIKEHAQNYSY